MSGLTSAQQRELADTVHRETEAKLLKMAAGMIRSGTLPWLAAAAMNRAVDAARNPEKKNGTWVKPTSPKYSTVDAEIACFRLVPVYQHEPLQTRVLFINDLLAATKGEEFTAPLGPGDERIYMEVAEIERMPFPDHEDVYYPIDKEEAKIEWKTYLNGSYEKVPNRISWVYSELLMEHVSRLFFELANTHYFIAPPSGRTMTDVGKLRIIAARKNGMALRMTYDRAVGNAVLGRTTEYLAANGISIRKPQ